MLINSRLKLSAQNVFYNDNGAFTGEISHEMLKDLGCSWVMIGHSERRIHLFETNEMVNKKIIFSCKKSFNIIFNLFIVIFGSRYVNYLMVYFCA